MLENRVNKLTYKKSIIFYLSIIAFFPILILGYYSYYTYVGKITEKIEISTEAATNQTKNRIDALLLNIRKSYMETVEEDEVSWLLNHDIDYSDYSYLLKATDALQGDNYLMDYISGYTVINFNTGWVLSNRGMFQYELVENQLEIEELKNHDNESLNRCFWLDRTRESRSSKLRRENIDLSGLSLVIKVPMVKKEPYGLVVININEDKLYQLVKETKEADMTILDKEGNIVYSSNEEVAHYYSLHIEELLEQDSKSIQIKDKNSYMTAAASSDVINWVYVASYDLDIAREDASGIISLMGILLAIVCILLVSIYFIVKRIYTPISNLTNYVKEITVDRGKEREDNEFEYLTTSIGELVDKKNFMENLIVSQQTQLTELFQLRLIRGDIRGEQLDFYMKQLNISAKSVYMIMSINIKPGKTADKDILVNQEAMQDAMRIDIVEKMPDSIKKALVMHAVCNHRAISLVIGGDEKEVLEQKVCYIFTEFEKYVREQYNLCIRCGVSAAFDELIEYRKAYNQSIESLKNQSVVDSTELREQSDLAYYTDIKPFQEEYIYDIVLEKEIKEAVDEGNKEQAFEIVDRFMDSLIEYRVPQNDRCLHLHRFLVAILMVMTDAGLSISELNDKEESNIFLNFNQIYDMNKLRYCYKYKFIIPVIEALNSYRADKSGTIIEAIRNLVKEKRGDLTLTECAEELHYHPTYIWKVMKAEGQTTFSDFIAEYKLGEAKKLLEETNMTIAEIAKELNYTNTQNFIRFFNKLEGITPGKYRKREGEGA